MLKYSLFIGAVLFLLIGTGKVSYAQEKTAKKKQDMFFGIGPVAYKGDLNSGYDKWSMAFHAGIKFNRYKKVNGNFSIMIGSVTGQNVNYSFDDGNLPVPSPNRFFTTRIASLNYEVHYNFINKDRIKVYASQGIGLLRFEPQDEFNESLVDQIFTRSANETYGNITLMLPTQIGALFTLPNDYSVGIQLGYSNTLSDYLDNISDWSNSKGQDNIFSYRFLIHIPVSL